MNCGDYFLIMKNHELTGACAMWPAESLCLLALLRRAVPDAREAGLQGFGELDSSRYLFRGGEFISGGRCVVFSCKRKRSAELEFVVRYGTSHSRLKGLKK